MFGAIFNLANLVNTSRKKLLTLIYQFMSLIISKPNLVCTSIEMFLNVKNECGNC